VAGYTKIVYPQTVTHPSINRARRRVTTLIETYPPPPEMMIAFITWMACYFYDVCWLSVPSERFLSM